MRLGHVQEIIRYECVLIPRLYLEPMFDGVVALSWLDNFEKVKVLGVGATGIVYELKHKQNGRRYALKEMEIKNKVSLSGTVIMKCFFMIVYSVCRPKCRWLFLRQRC